MEKMTVDEYRASIQGKQNRAQGLSFENIVNSACEEYKLYGIANIEKTPEPMKIIGVVNRKLGYFKAVFEKAAQPDYKGTMKGGRSVVFDAKSTVTDRIQQSTITQEQWKALDLHAAMGAWCFVLVFLGNKYYRVPWEKWKSMKADCGHQYMNAVDMEPYALAAWPAPLRFLDNPQRNTSKYREPVTKDR